MNTSRPPLLAATDLLATRYGKLHPLTDHEVAVLHLIERKTRHACRSDTRLLTERAEIRQPHLIVAGWACRSRELADARRQIANLFVPGDVIGLYSVPNPIAFMTVTSLSPMRLIEAAELAVARRDQARVPGLATALDIAAAEDEFFMLAQIVRLGRQTAYERVANLFMELEHRMSARGLSHGGAFSFPLTQDTLADAVGLSVVHVNRTLQQMRRERRIELSHGRLVILDKTALGSAGGFIPPYSAAVETSPASPPLNS